MINLTNCREYNNTFGGSETKKKILYNGTFYMVKFPDRVRQKKNKLSYMNNQFSEDIGCKIFKSLGIETQNTFLAEYNLNGVNKIVVACEDFTQNGAVLIEFHKLSLMQEENNSNRTMAELSAVMNVIDNNKSIINKRQFKNSFWKMFIIDGFIGNHDRNLENFGVLELPDGTVKFAPIFDCGSALSGLLTEEEMQERLMNYTDFKNGEYNVYSCFRQNHDRILFSDIMKNPPEELAEAIKELIPLIDFGKIQEIIIGTEGMTKTHKEYMLASLKLRYDTILAPALEYVCSLDRTDNLEDKDEEEEYER